MADIGFQWGENPPQSRSHFISHTSVHFTFNLNVCFTPNPNKSVNSESYSTILRLGSLVFLSYSCLQICIYLYVFVM